MPLINLLCKLAAPKEWNTPEAMYGKPEEVIETPMNASSIYRPISFTDYIGQEKAKNMLKAFIAGSRKFEKIYPHTIIHGNAGCGKTTLARIIASEVGVPFTELLAQDTEVESFLESINKANGGIIFLDEVHRMKRDTVEQLYSIMEDFMWNGKSVPEFTLIGATTEIGEIIKNRKPFYDRFKIIIELEDYTDDDMYNIIKKYVKKTFEEERLQTKALKIIAGNSRTTPRKAFRLADYLYYSGKKIKKVLADNQIIDKGYTEKDLRVLEYLHKNGKPVGLDTISLYLGVPVVTYNYEIEPYLVKSGLLMRTSRGRTITQDGIIEMKSLQQKKGV